MEALHEAFFLTTCLQFLKLISSPASLPFVPHDTEVLQEEARCGHSEFEILFSGVAPCISCKPEMQIKPAQLRELCKEADAL